MDSRRQPETAVISSASSTVKALWSHGQKLVIENDMLYRKWDDKKGVTLQAIVPLSEQPKLLSLCHDHLTSGHLGVRIKVSKVRQSFYLTGLQRDIRHYVAGCENCQKGKNPIKTPRAPMQILGAGCLVARLATDILGELPLTERGNRYILIVSDYFTKWTECFAIPNMEARTVADVIVRETITKFGVPSLIHMDRGRQFEGQLFTEMCKMLNIKKSRTTPYHPQSDGMVEWFNKTLVRTLKTYVNEHHSDWDDYLPFVTMAYTSVEHETTGCSPNYLMLEREVHTPLDNMYEIPASVKSIPANRWAWELKVKMEAAHRIVRENISGAMLRQKLLHDRNVSWEKFYKEDEVYVYFQRHIQGLSPKFTYYWRGAFRVSEKNTDVTYKVLCGRRGKP